MKAYLNQAQAIRTWKELAVLRYLLTIALLIFLGNTLVWSASPLPPVTKGGIKGGIGIADFTNVTKKPELDDYTRAVPELILTHLAQSQKLSFVDRQELDKIINEIGLGQTGIVDPETAARVGHLAGASYMFIGQLSGYQEGKRIVITTRLVHVESAHVVAGWHTKASPEELDVQAIRLANKILAMLFPMSPWAAAGRSLLIPGWGQLANQRPSGYVFLPLSVAALGALAYTQFAYMAANDDYQELRENALKPYANLEDREKAKSEAAEAEKKRDNRERTRWIAAGTVAGVWLINVADAFLEARLLNKKQQLAEARVELHARIEPQEVRVLWVRRF